jgi:hypothetical protein
VKEGIALRKENATHDSLLNKEETTLARLKKQRHKIQLKVSWCGDWHF